MSYPFMRLFPYPGFADRTEMSPLGYTHFIRASAHRRLKLNLEHYRVNRVSITLASSDTAREVKRMEINAPRLIRWSGLCATGAGVIFAGIQPFHPPDVIASVTTGAWAFITPLKTVMCVLFLLGITGIYFRQVNTAGRIGLIGFLLLGLSWVLQTAFVFAEAFIMPLLANTAPKFVDGYLGLASGHVSEVNLGVLPALYGVVGVAYMLGGLLFGIATFRARVLPQRTALVLATASLLTPLAALLPHAIQRYAAVPVGLALAFLGFALWSERPATGYEAATDAAGLPLPQLKSF